MGEGGGGGGRGEGEESMSPLTWTTNLSIDPRTGSGWEDSNLQYVHRPVKHVQKVFL